MRVLLIPAVNDDILSTLAFFVGASVSNPTPVFCLFQKFLLCFIPSPLTVVLFNGRCSDLRLYVCRFHDRYSSIQVPVHADIHMFVNTHTHTHTQVSPFADSCCTSSLGRCHFDSSAGIPLYLSHDEWCMVQPIGHGAFLLSCLSVSSFPLELPSLLACPTEKIQFLDITLRKRLLYPLRNMTPVIILLLVVLTLLDL